MLCGGGAVLLKFLFVHIQICLLHVIGYIPSINGEEKAIYRLYIFGHIKCSPLEKTISSADINVGVYMKM